VIVDAIRAAQRDDFRIVHYNVLGNHVHLIVEAEGRVALGNGVRGFGIRVTRGVNRALGRNGALVEDRFHARALRNPTETRNALRYVLLNGNRHEVERGAEALWFGVDAHSSGAWFDGWTDERWMLERPSVEQPTVEARTWLLRQGWRRAGGLIAFDEIVAT
jgi:hypothetical protein